VGIIRKILNARRDFIKKQMDFLEKWEVDLRERHYRSRCEILADLGVLMSNGSRVEDKLLIDEVFRLLPDIRDKNFYLRMGELEVWCSVNGLDIVKLKDTMFKARKDVELIDIFRASFHGK